MSNYEKGMTLEVRIQRHDNPVMMVAIQRCGCIAGGGLMLVLEADVDMVLNALNSNPVDGEHGKEN